MSPNVRARHRTRQHAYLSGQRHRPTRRRRPRGPARLNQRQQLPHRCRRTAALQHDVLIPWSTAPDRYRGVSREQAARIRQRDRRTCQQCGRSGWQIDRIINVAAGGTDDDTNLHVLCDSCHDAKTQAEAAAGRAKVSRNREPEPHPGRIPRRSTKGVGGPLARPGARRLA
ncbi:HNH endonuclease [Nocardia sp. NPDC006044]|uniref:HNH endonuclease n=1 Tax=Nocardia sp. NPDC006044 TaxID=3364306 RepID=UPI0036B0F2C3